jgi:hypothetical protein
MEFPNSISDLQITLKVHFEIEMDFLKKSDIEFQLSVFNSINVEIKKLIDLDVSDIGDKEFTLMISNLAKASQLKRHEAIKKYFNNKANLSNQEYIKNKEWLSAKLSEDFYLSFICQNEEVSDAIFISMTEWIEYISEYQSNNTQLKSSKIISDKKIVICPNCKKKYSVPTNKYIEINCKDCLYKWKEFT